MDELWIIYVLVFGAALLAVQGVYLVAFRARAEKRTINRRLVLSEQLNNATEVLDALRRERGFGLIERSPVFRNFNTLMIQTGLRADATTIIGSLVGLCAALFMIFGYLLKNGLLAFSLAVPVSCLLVYLYLSYVRKKRIARFGEQLPDALDVIVRGLRAGHPFRVALALVAREMPDPIGTEFGIMADEITFGLEMTVAVDNLCRRVGLEDLSYFAVSTNIQNQTGGNLAEILGRLSRLLRSRMKLRLKIRALTSEGRLSAIFLSLAPFILFGIITLISPGYFGEIRNHPAVPLALTGALILLGAGNFTMYRMVNFKF